MLRSNTQFRVLFINRNYCMHNTVDVVGSQGFPTKNAITARSVFSPMATPKPKPPNILHSLFHSAGWWIGGFRLWLWWGRLSVWPVMVVMVRGVVPCCGCVCCTGTSMSVLWSVLGLALCCSRVWRFRSCVPTQNLRQCHRPSRESLNFLPYIFIYVERLKMQIATTMTWLLYIQYSYVTTSWSVSTYEAVSLS